MLIFLFLYFMFLYWSHQRYLILFKSLHYAIFLKKIHVSQVDMGNYLLFNKITIIQLTVANS